ncbi:hypothetical protein [Sinobaca sp. H24]|nr:hypothetical protein [Sinobaca sp. H24]
MNKLSRLFFKASRTMEMPRPFVTALSKRLARRVLGRQAGKLIRKIIR